MPRSLRTLRGFAGSAAFWLGSLNAIFAVWALVRVVAALVLVFVRHVGHFAPLPLLELQDAILRSAVWFGIMLWAERIPAEPERDPELDDALLDV